MSNLPPGVSNNDLPGNRPEDTEWDSLFEFLSNCDLEPVEIRAAVEDYLSRIANAEGDAR